MAIAVTGSLAYDHIMVFPDQFSKHILPDKVHMLNVAFNVDQLSIEFGGTGGNIAYNLALLNHKPLLLGTVGKDFESYRLRIQEWGLDDTFLKVLDDEYTAQAFITTDQQDNQITAFHGGAMFRAHEQPFSGLPNNVELAIVAPNGIQAMKDHAEFCRQGNIAWWFDPGQALNALSKEDLRSMLPGAQGLIVNDYEWQLFRDRSEWSEQDVFSQIPVVLVTLGHEGVDIMTAESSVRIQAVPDIEVVDPTGAGDAFRAGLLYGLQEGLEMADSCRYACAVASFAVERKGTQNHQFDLPAVEQRLQMIS